MFRRIAAVGGALVAGFPLWLLGSQVSGGQIAGPDVVLRWRAAIALLGGVVPAPASAVRVGPLVHS